MRHKEVWGSRSGFILAAVGSAIGLGNIWRFPYMVYENGGGAFLVPYFTAMLCAGIPFMILEYGLGHRYKGSAPRVFAAISRRWEWLGWWQALTAFLISSYYAVVIAWAMGYSLLAFTQGWGADPEAYFFEHFLGRTDSPLHPGGVRWHVLAGAALTWAVCWLAVFTGVRKGIERLNKVFMPLLFVLVAAFITRSLMLPGAMDGLDWLFRPDFTAMLRPDVWADAFGQVFYSLSLGYALMISYAGYLPEDADISNNACMTTFINCGFSVLSGIMVFGVLGFMAHQQGVTVDTVVQSGIGLAFVTLPTAIPHMPAPGVFGPMFFVSLVVAGLSSLVCLTEASVAALMDKTGMSRKGAASLVCGASLAAGCLFATGGGLYLLDIVDHFANNYGVLCGGLVEIVLVAWLCDLPGMHEHINAVSDFRIGASWRWSLRWLIPLSLGAMVLLNLAGDLDAPYGGYSGQAVTLFGWLPLCLMAVAAVALARRADAFDLPVGAGARPRS